MLEDYLKVEIEMLKEHYISINGYVSTHDYFLKHGHRFEGAVLNNEEMDFAQAWRGECPTKQCYANAQRLMLESCSKYRIGYVEGVATSGLIPVDHAWNTVNGKIIDLTWGPMRKVVKKDSSFYLRRTSRVLGIVPDGFEYYGVEVSYEEMAANMLAHRVFTSVIDDYTCGFPILRGVKGHENGALYR